MGSLEKRKQIIIDSQITGNKRRKDWEVDLKSLRDDYLLETKRADSAETACLEYIEGLKQSRISREFEDEAEILGRGAYGIVYMQKHKLDGKFYAIKRIQFVGSNAVLLPEVHALSSLKHEGIIQYHTCWIEDDQIESGKTFEVVSLEKAQDFESDDDVAVYFDFRRSAEDQQLPQSLFIQMELCKGSLYDEIIQGKVDYQRGIEFFAQLVEAVAYMHGQHVIHKDLSSSNVFLDESSSRVKVGDFGIAKIGMPDLHPTSLGNQQYEAPERSNGVEIDSKVDVFSLGKLLLELISNISTASERARIFEGFSKEGILPACLHQEDGELGEDGKLILSLTSMDPKDRPSAEEVSLMLKRRTIV